VILDSTYLFDLMAENPGAFETGTRLVEDGEVQWLPTPVLAETYYGAATARGGTTTEEVRNRLLGYPRLDVSDEVARTAGFLLAEADDSSGGNSGVGPNDAYIAAMAEIMDDAVLTKNVSDFERLGVAVEEY